MKKVFIFGFGYTAKVFSKLLIANNYQVCGTSRNYDIKKLEKEYGVELCDFNPTSIRLMLNESQVILICIPPNKNFADPVLTEFKQDIVLNNGKLEWVGYLSTTGVYGNHDGAWITEESECINPGELAQKRIIAEQDWLSLYHDYNIPVHIFRLAGIYGKGRSSLDRIIAGTDYSVFKPGQFFSRIHVEDISRILFASISKPTPGEIYNISDDCPSASHEVDEYAAGLLGIKKPKLIAYKDADLFPMAREFYNSNKRVSNSKIKKKLNLTLLYPSYREGLKNISDSLS